MASVTFSASVGGDGSTVTDDSNPTTGLANGGHRTRFVPALSQVVAVASNTVTKATEASSSATAAAASAASAASAATAAAASYDSFDDRYLGAKSSDPIVDNDGNPLLVGALYWNSVAGEMRAYSGNAWAAAYLPAGAYATLNGTETLTSKTLVDPKITLGGTNGTAGQVPVSQGSGLPPAWTTFSGGPSGITTTSAMSANITLTAASTQVQNVAPTSENLSVFLPDATTIANPANPIFIIRNTATVFGGGGNARSWPVCVRRQDGSLVSVINPGGEAFIALTDKTTARGDWQATGNGLSQSRFFGYFSGSSSDDGVVPPLQLSNGNFIVPVGASINYVTKSGAAASYGLNGNFIVGLVEIDSTSVLVISAVTTTLYAYYVTVNATTLTVGSATSFTMSTGMNSNWYGALAKLNDTTYVVSWASSNSIEGVVLTLSGSTRTFGSQQALKTGLSTVYMNPQGLVTYSPTQILCAFGAGVNPSFTASAFAMTVSGTTITAGSTVTLCTGGSVVSYAHCSMLNGSAVVVTKQNANTVAAACTISGTTVTAGTAVTVFSGGDLNYALRQYTLNTTTAVYTPFNNQNRRLVCFSVSGTTITARYSSTGHQQIGVIRDTVRNRVFSGSNVSSYYTQYDRFGNTSFQVNDFGATSITDSATIVDSGDMLGPAYDTASSNGSFSLIGATSGGMMYSNTDSQYRGVVMTMYSWDGVFSGIYGQAQNALSRFFGVSNINTSSNTPILDGLTVIRGSGGIGVFMEAVV